MSLDNGMTPPVQPWTMDRMPIRSPAKRPPYLGKRGQCLRSLDMLLRANNKYTQDGAKVCGYGTQAKRAKVMMQSMNDIHDMGFKITDARQFRTKHMRALVDKWVKDELSAATLRNRVSIMATLCVWIGKSDMVRSPEQFLTKDQLRLSEGAQASKAWTDNGIDPAQKILQLDELDAIVGLQARLALVFALRIEEAACLKPWVSDQGEFLNVSAGTKGGRPRAVPIDHPVKRMLIDQAKALASSPDHSTIPRNYTLLSWMNHVYYVLDKAGVTKKKSGITFHGLRHQALNDLYEAITGAKSPVRGGQSGEASPELDRLARYAVAETAGHSRISVSSVYLGGMKKSR